MKLSLVLLLLVSMSAVACPKGSYEYNGGCEVDIQPEIAPSVRPSDEQVFDDKMPSYQREGIQIINAPNMAAEYEKEDREKAEANAEGKRAAGLK